MDGSSLAPAFLVAMPQLRDPNFRRTVVLLIHHDEQGTFGVVLNRPTQITAMGLCASLDLSWCGAPEKGIRWDPKRRRASADYDEFVARLLEKRRSRWRDGPEAPGPRIDPGGSS